MRPISERSNRYRGGIPCLLLVLCCSTVASQEVSGNLPALVIEPEVRAGYSMHESEDLKLYKSGMAFLSAGDREKALVEFRTLRIRYPESPFFSLSLFISAKIAFEQGSNHSAAQFLEQLIRKDNPYRSEAFLLYARILYKDRIYDRAAEYYSAAEQNGAVLTSLDRLHQSEILALHVKDIALARAWFRKIDIEDVMEPEHRNLFALVKKKIYWSDLNPVRMGLLDSHVSALAHDADDLWIGTWAGGIARYTRTSGAVDVFQKGWESLTANTVRSFGITNKYVWIGTYAGLFVFSKGRSTLRTIGVPAELADAKIECVLPTDDGVFVGTLGAGLWLFSNETWEKLPIDATAGTYISAMASVHSNICLGTMERGVLLLNRENGSLVPLSQLNAAFKAKNITAIVPDGTRFWIGTYGQGLYLWDTVSNAVDHYGTQTGELKDDWVLCGVATPHAVYFGTFGGGVSSFNRKTGAWTTLGPADGLASLDIATVSYERPSVYFGTLGAGISVFYEEEE